MVAVLTPACARADSDIGVLDSICDYKRICDEILSVDGVVSIGLIDGVITHVAICDGADTKTFPKKELLDAASGLQDGS